MWVRVPSRVNFIFNSSRIQIENRRKKTTPRGFEPLRAEPNGFLVHLLNHSDTVSSAGRVSWITLLVIWPERKSPTAWRERQRLGGTSGRVMRSSRFPFGKMRPPGIEPGAQAWEACMLPLHYELWCLSLRNGHMALLRGKVRTAD